MNAATPSPLSRPPERRGFTPRAGHPAAVAVLSAGAWDTAGRWPPPGSASGSSLRREGIRHASIARPGLDPPATHPAVPAAARGASAHPSPNGSAEPGGPTRSVA